MLDSAYTVFGLLGATICFISVYFIWRISQRPWSTLFLISWLFFYNIFSTVDSIVWSGNDVSDSPDGEGYCDITSRVKTVFSIGVLGSTICICQFLVDTSDPTLRAPNRSTSSRRRRNMVDVFFGLILPLVFVLLKFIVEPSRYLILGVLGCQGTFDGSWPAIPLFFVWPPIFTLVAFAQIVIFMRHWFIRRRDFQEDWAITLHNGISKLEFCQLAIPVVFIVATYIPLSLYFLVQFLLDRDPTSSFSWSRIHGASYGDIYKLSHPKAPWFAWMQILLAGAPLLAIAASPKLFFECCLEWLFDHMPIGLQVNLPRMRQLSALCKERRQAMYRAGSRIGGKYELDHPMRSRHWNDWDYDTLDARSTPSSYITVLRYEEEMERQTHVTFEQLTGKRRSQLKLQTTELKKSLKS